MPCGVQVSDVARSNIQKVIERGDRLDDLQARAGKCLFMVCMWLWGMGVGGGFVCVWCT